MADFIVQNFSGGETDDPDNLTSVSFDVLRGFNLNPSNYALTPERSVEADEDKTFNITKFLQASDGEFYGFGSGTGGSAGKMQIYLKDDPITGSWATATNGVSTGNGSIVTVLGSYKDYVYFVWDNPRILGRWGDITATPTFTDSFGTFATAPTTISTGIIGGDAAFYFGHDNLLGQVSTAGVFTEDKLILAPEFKITSLAKWGSYLAIAASGDGIKNNSTLFLWNYIDALPSVSVDFGVESLQTIGNVDGNMVGVSLSSSRTDINFNQTMNVKLWSGGQTATLLWEKPLGEKGWSIEQETFIEDNNLYFLLNVNSNSAPSERKGVWSVGRKNQNYPWRVSQRLKMINDTVLSNVDGWYKLGDYWWVAHSVDGSVERTNNDDAYLSTAVLETEILSLDDPTQTGRLMGVACVFEALPASSTITVYYRKDEETAWTQIATETTTNATILEATEISGTVQLPTEWRYIQFKIEAYGGAVITGFKAKYDPMTSQLD